MTQPLPSLRLTSRHLSRHLTLLTALCLLSTVACGGSEPEPSPEGTGGTSSEAEGYLGGDLTDALPTKMSELGLYADPAEQSGFHLRAAYFEPQYALWTNGSDKQRFVVVKKGQTIDTSKTPWVFPNGTLFFKTFSYEQEDGTPRPIETRVIQLTADGPSYAAYIWNAEGTDAELSDVSATLEVDVVTPDTGSFKHTVPSKLMCRMCHESQESPIIGFDELRLNSKLPGANETQLEALAQAGILSAAPESPDAIVADDDATAEVLGYLHGNCAHCHNGSGLASSAFDLRHPVALQNTLNQPTVSDLLHGLRIDPGSPETSAVYTGISRDGANGSPMPPIGIDLVDEAAVQMIHDWISSLPANGN